MKIIALSDTHNQHHNVSVPLGDVLVHAGDACRAGSMEELCKFAQWLNAQPHRHKIFVPGNHDAALERERETALALFNDDVHVLINSGVTISGVKFWGSPFTPRFGDWAFAADRGAPIAEHWALIPEDLDVLITHGPAQGRLAMVGNQDVGCEALRAAVDLKKPRVHIFGHIHYSAGSTCDENYSLFVNAAVCTESYRPKNKPWIIQYTGRCGRPPTREEE